MVVVTDVGLIGVAWKRDVVGVDLVGHVLLDDGVLVAQGLLDADQGEVPQMIILMNKLKPIQS